MPSSPERRTGSRAGWPRTTGMAGDEKRSVRARAPPNNADIERLPDGPSNEGSGRDYGHRSSVSKTLKVRFSLRAGRVIVRYSAARARSALELPVADDRQIREIDAGVVGGRVIDVEPAAEVVVAQAIE